MTYTCSICHSINHASRFHCQHCGTIPERYSVLGKAATFKYDELGLPRIVEVKNATGAERQDSFRTSKSSMRTVPLDYYAEAPAASK